MVKGKCTGVGCPIRSACLRYTTKEFEKEYGNMSPPWIYDEDLQTTKFPKRCKDFLTNESHKPAMRPYEIQD